MRWLLAVPPSSAVHSGCWPRTASTCSTGTPFTGTIRTVRPNKVYLQALKQEDAQVVPVRTSAPINAPDIPW